MNRQVWTPVLPFPTHLRAFSLKNYFLISMLLFLAASGCASNAEGINTGAEPVASDVSALPDSLRTYAPLQVVEVPPLPDYEPLIYESQPPFEYQSFPIPATAPVTEIDATAPNRPSEGYRIQIYSGRDKAMAKRMEGLALSRVAYPVYLNYEAPQYKVRLGNFASRDHATLECERLKHEGFPEAWVIRTTIFVQR